MHTGSSLEHPPQAAQQALTCSIVQEASSLPGGRAGASGKALPARSSRISSQYNKQKKQSTAAAARQASRLSFFLSFFLSRSFFSYDMHTYDDPPAAAIHGSFFLPKVVFAEFSFLLCFRSTARRCSPPSEYTCRCYMEERLARSLTSREARSAPACSRQGGGWSLSASPPSIIGRVFCSTFSHGRGRGASHALYFSYSFGMHIVFRRVFSRCCNMTCPRCSYRTHHLRLYAFGV